MNIQTLIVASRTNVKEGRKSFLDIRLQVTQFLIKVRNLVGENIIDGENVKTGLKSVQSLLNNHLSLPYINFVTLLNQKSGNLVSSVVTLCNFSRLELKKKTAKFSSALHRCIICFTVTWNGGGSV